MDWTSIYAESGDEELLPTHPNVAPRLSRLVSSVYHHHRSNSGSSPIRSRHRSGLFLQALLTRFPGGGGSGVLSTSTTEAVAVVSSPTSRVRLDRRESSSRSQDPSEATTDGDTTTSSSGYTLHALYCLSINYILGVGCLGVPYAFARAGLALGACLVLVVTLLSYWTVMWVAEAMLWFGITMKSEKEEEEEGTKQTNRQLELPNHAPGETTLLLHPHETNASTTNASQRKTVQLKLYSSYFLLYFVCYFQSVSNLEI